MNNNFTYHFKVDLPPVFLTVTRAEENAVGMSILSNPRETTWAEIFYGLMLMPTEELRSKLPFSAVMCLNRVAQTSRRAIGNTFFLHQKMSEAICMCNPPFPKHLDHTNLITLKDFPEDLLIATYFEIRKPTNPDVVPTVVCIDGPFAEFEGRVYVNPNWQSYFYKARIVS